MMEIPATTRHFYPDERRILETLQTKKETELRKKKNYHYFIIAAALAIGFNYLAAVITIDFLVFVFGTLAVFAYCFAVFMPYEVYKDRKKLKSFISDLNALIERDSVTTYLVRSTRIALAEEYEDESDLFIVEYGVNKVLYLWNYNYSLQKKLPCADFEIYEESFYKLTDRLIYPLSKRIELHTRINSKNKWAYMKTHGAPEHLTTEEADFDTLIEQYNSCV